MQCYNVSFKRLCRLDKSLLETSMAERMTAHHRSPASHSIIAAAFEAAAKTCRERGLQFTTIRRQVIETLISSERPLSAYELIDALLEPSPGVSRRRRFTARSSISKSSTSSLALRAGTLSCRALIPIIRTPACSSSATIAAPPPSSRIARSPATPPLSDFKSLAASSSCRAPARPVSRPAILPLPITRRKPPDGAAGD
ncbi:hypothetical protein ILFOPFJJ_05578 [Ensifer psoraleae]|nr:hypothetical protein [Sinorhizobium psoraleae]